MAPYGLCLVGWLCVASKFVEPDVVRWILSVLVGCVVAAACVVILFIRHLVQLPVSPGAAAFTFPTLICANGVIKWLYLDNDETMQSDGFVAGCWVVASCAL